VEELAEGMGGLKDLAFVLMQHMHLGTANLDDSIYIHGTLKFLIVSEGFVPSLCPALLAAGIVPILTDFVANLGSHVDKVNSIKRPALLKHSLCILMSTIMRSTSSLYP
jgi:predicted anti-sigma-YlaC factor YlaD